MLEGAGRSTATVPAAPSIQCALMTAQAATQDRPDLGGLISHVVARYHDLHRQEFPEAIALARRVEAVHAAEPECPRGLADLLALMFDDLESHQQREGQVLFPMLRAGGALARVCRKLDADLVEHMRLENENLFAPFLD